MRDPSQHERHGQGAPRDRTGAGAGEWGKPGAGARGKPDTLTQRLRPALAVVAIIGAVFVVAAAITLNLGIPKPSVIVVERNPLLDQPAPDFHLQTLDGRSSVALSDFRGRPVIVNFWASWCVPCRQEFPLLRAARQRHTDKGLEILGVIHDDGPQAAAAFAATHGAGWPLLLDPDDSVWNAYRGALLPITYYVDRDGIVRAVSYGPPPSGVLDEQLAKIL